MLYKIDHVKKIATVFVCCLPGVLFASVSNGPYVGLEIGAANQIINFTPSTFNLDTNGSTLYNPEVGFLARLNLGYNINRFNGFELGTTYNFGTTHNYPNNQGNLNTPVTTIDFSYLIYLPTIVNQWSVFGRVGLAYDWTGSSYSCNGVSSLGNISGSGFADVLGAGLMYRITPNTSFRVEWISNGLFSPININSSSGSIGTWTNQTFQLGLNYHF